MFICLTNMGDGMMNIIIIIIQMDKLKIHHQMKMMIFKELSYKIKYN
jgi:hypothetical protein